MGKFKLRFKKHGKIENKLIPQIFDISGDVKFCTGVKMFFSSNAGWFDSLIFFPLTRRKRMKHLEIWNLEFFLTLVSTSAYCTEIHQPFHQRCPIDICQ